MLIIHLHRLVGVMVPCPERWLASRAPLYACVFRALKLGDHDLVHEFGSVALGSEIEVPAMAVLKSPDLGRVCSQNWGSE